MTSSTSEAQIKNEIARLTATINQRKSLLSGSGAPRTSSRYNTYVNPNYKPPANKYIRPTHNAVQRPVTPRTAAIPPSEVKDVILNGVAFESSSRSLVRKDLPKHVSGSSTTQATTQDHTQFTRKSGHLVPTTRVYKPKPTHGRRRILNRNMTLNNNARPYHSRPKRVKYFDKPCPRFTTTGTCSRGLTCPYQHDPSKIAICWNFLHGNCSNKAETCNLSHDPTPERTPLCLHFLNKGRCTRAKCPFPHVNVGARRGVCRDFAVLGYCSRGLDCEKQHVRECPDFAENGTCSTKGCKLPHVIRANRNRKVIAVATPADAPPTSSDSTGSKPFTTNISEQSQVSVEAAQLGDEYISLTFNESESETDSDEDDEDDNDDDSEEEANSIEDSVLEPA